MWQRTHVITIELMSMENKILKTYTITGFNYLDKKNHGKTGKFLIFSWTITSKTKDYIDIQVNAYSEKEALEKAKETVSRDEYTIKSAVEWVDRITGLPAEFEEKNKSAN